MILIVIILLIVLSVRFTVIPYVLIAGVLRAINRAESCSITLPFRVVMFPIRGDILDEECFITVPNIAISKYRKYHECGHVLQVREYMLKYGSELGKWMFIGAILYQIIRYGYTDSPLEIDANEYAEEMMRKEI